MEELLARIRKCTVCLPHLEHGVNPVLAAHTVSRIAIVGQAPGSVVHRSGVPWQDKSGDRLRQWLHVGHDEFYDSKRFALLPIGFCYPGTGKSGDNPPRPECAPLWHPQLLGKMPNLELTLLIGSYAQAFYLRDKCRKSLTETVRNYEDYLPEYFPLPHPSPRNNIWLKKNPWFAEELLPELQARMESAAKAPPSEAP